MAVYDFQCLACKSLKRDVVLKMTHHRNERPRCCGGAMDVYFSKAPTMHLKDYDLPNGGFIAPSMPKNPDGSFQVITSRKQNRELMKRHNLVDANDMGPAPSFADQFKEREDIAESIEAITPTPEVAAELKRVGLHDIVE